MNLVPKEETGIAEENWKVMVKHEEGAKDRNLPSLSIKREEKRRINHFPLCHQDRMAKKAEEETA